jgi:N-acetylglucosaminyl-diphospho-decaprenol L-rhamnosyltransferase
MVAPHATGDTSRPTLSPVDLSIIIVSWNVWDLLRACLHSIERVSRPLDTEDSALRTFGAPASPLRLEVIVVDNGSEDATIDLVPARFPWVRLIANASNLGFTGGNNVGYAASRGRYVYFLNPDTELAATPAAQDGLFELYSSVAGDDTIGMAGPRLRYADGLWQNSRRTFPTRLTGFLESTWLGNRWPRNPWARRLHMEDWPADFAHDVDWLVGAAMLARRTALEQVRMPEFQGPFDEGFFMYSEEMDLCRRLKDAGWRIVYHPQALVVHYEGRSSEQAVATRHIEFNTSKVRYYDKYFGRIWSEALRRFLLTEYRWQLWVERVKRLLGHRRELRTQRIEVYKQVLASGLH